MIQNREQHNLEQIVVTRAKIVTRAAYLHMLSEMTILLETLNELSLAQKYIICFLKEIIVTICAICIQHVV
jgi:hypothetical protein